jgi:hypothetical protein
MDRVRFLIQRQAHDARILRRLPEIRRPQNNDPLQPRRRHRRRLGQLVRKENRRVLRVVT